MDKTELVMVLIVSVLIGFLVGILIGVNIITPIINENECIGYQNNKEIFYIHHIEKKEINKEDHIYELTLRCYQKGESK